MRWRGLRRCEHEMEAGEEDEESESDANRLDSERFPWGVVESDWEWAGVSANPKPVEE